MEKEYKPVNLNKEIELTDEYYMLYEMLRNVLEELRKARTT